MEDLLAEPVRQTLWFTDRGLVDAVADVLAHGGDAWFSPRREKLHETARRRLVRVEAAIDVHLVAIAPEQVLEGRTLVEHARQPVMAVLSERGFDRYGWVLAVAGGGTDLNPEHLLTYMRLVARWSALTDLAEALREVSTDVAYGIDINPGTEAVRRHSTLEIRYAWASELILGVVARVVAGERRYAALDHVSTAAVRDIFSGLRELFASPEALPGAWASRQTAAANLLAQQVALPAGSGSGRSFRELVVSPDIERRPFVTFDGEVVPVGVREAALGLEQAIFEHARDVLPGKDRADLFEATVSGVLDEVLPPGARTLAGPLSVPVPRSADPGEVDLAVVLDGARRHVIVGEAKSSFAGTSPSGVLGAYTADVGKAVKQLRTRVERLRGGAALVGSSEQVVLGAGDVITGLAVPLHGYATASLHRDTLHELDADHPDIAVVPLHQLVLVTSRCASVEALESYLDFRADLIAAEVYVLDEVDIAVSHLDPEAPRNVRVAVRERASGGTTLLKGFCVSGEAAVLTGRPSSAAAWSRQLLDDGAQIT